MANLILNDMLTGTKLQEICNILNCTNITYTVDWNFESLKSNDSNGFYNQDYDLTCTFKDNAMEYELSIDPQQHELKLRNRTLKQDVELFEESQANAVDNISLELLGKLVEVANIIEYPKL